MHWFSRKDLNIQVPHKVEHGLRPRSVRGRMGQSWWSQKLVNLIEDDPKRPHLEAGRRYARKGQIISMKVEPGVITSRVQGTQPTAYWTKLLMPALTDDAWRRLLPRLVARSEYMASLLAGLVPSSLEALFARQEEMLLPESADSVQWSCTCQDEDNPCKHVAAVFYLFADQLDSDPFLLLQWRGKDRHELLAALHESWGADPAMDIDAGEEEEVLTDRDIPRFFLLPEDFDDLPYPPPSDQPDVIRRLGFPPFFPPSDRTVQQTLAGLYTEND